MLVKDVLNAVVIGGKAINEHAAAHGERNKRKHCGNAASPAERCAKLFFAQRVANRKCNNA